MKKPPEFSFGGHSMRLPFYQRWTTIEEGAEDPPGPSQFTVMRISVEPDNPVVYMKLPVPPTSVIAVEEPGVHSAAVHGIGDISTWFAMQLVALV